MGTFLIRLSSGTKHQINKGRSYGQLGDGEIEFNGLFTQHEDISLTSIFNMFNI